MLVEKHKHKIADIISQYPDKRAALLPVLWLVQEEHGFVSEEAMTEVAALLDLTPPQVYQTISFYTMFNPKPIGKFHLQVCRSLICALVGAQDLMRSIDPQLGITTGETTPDTLFTWKPAQSL